MATGEVTAVSLPDLLTEVGALRTAIDGITDGIVSDESLTVFNTNLSNATPTDVNSQREHVWIVTYEDNLQFFDDPVNAIPNEGFGRLFTLTIPTADPDGAVGRMQTNSDLANLADTGIAAFVTAFEETARSPYGGTVNVIRIRYSGTRN
jgi:hypothetical protein